VTHIAKRNYNTQQKNSARVQTLLLSLFQSTLIHLHKLNQEKRFYQESSENFVDNSQNVTTSSFWTTATTATYKLIECINDLLTIPSFIEVIATLLQHSDRRIQCRAVQFFSDKLTATRDYLTEQHITLFLSTTKQLVSLVALDEPTLEVELSFSMCGCVVMDRNRRSAHTSLFLVQLDEQHSFCRLPFCDKLQRLLLNF
jgi:hypothetical protein